jgi:hypothetical protein
MTDWIDPDEEDDEYFAEITDVQPTGKDLWFFKIDALDTPPAALGEMSVADLVKMYRDVRDQLATDRTGWKAREIRVKTHLMIISMQLRDRGDTMGVLSFATPNGTAYRNTKEKFPISDWSALSKWVLATGNVHVLQKRLSPNAVKDVRDEVGELPPGVDSLKEIEFAVRSPTARKSRS